MVDLDVEVIIILRDCSALECDLNRENTHVQLHQALIPPYEKDNKYVWK